MVALVGRLEAEEISGGLCGGGGALALPPDGGCVVMEVVEGVASGVEVLRNDVVLCDGPRQFEVAGGDVAAAVGGRDEPVDYCVLES
jgi:hypothetical protein